MKIKDAYKILNSEEDDLMFENEDNKYKLPRMDLKKGYDKLKNDCIIFQNKNANVMINNNCYTAQNITVYINDEIYIEIEIEDCNIQENNRNRIKFISDDSWSIELTVNKLNMTTNIVEGYASEISCKKGKYETYTKHYYFIENLELNNEDEKLKINNSDKLKLIVRQTSCIFNITGCFYIEDCDEEHEIIIERIKHLLNYYSLDLASMRISCKCSNNDEDIELNFKPISKYNHFNHETPFGNFADFIMSSYPNYVKYCNKINNINYIIDYLSYLHREAYGDVKIAISCIVLEMFNNLFEHKNQGGIPPFIQELNNVLDKLNLDSEKLDSFFRKEKLLCNDGIISEIYAIRNNTFHGKTVSDPKTCLLLSSFVTILFLRLLEIDCEMQLEICGSDTINTKKFVKQFLKEGKNKNNKNNTSETDKIVTIEGKYYLPLKKLKNNNINKDTEYELIEYINKKSNIMLFREVDKL